jgi:hypothetical protein
MCNVTMKRFRVTTLAVEKTRSIRNYGSVSVLFPKLRDRQKAFLSAQHYIVISGLSGCTIFYIFLKTGRFLEKII